MSELNNLLIDEIVNKNTLEYNVMKCIEEMAELNVELIKTLTKGHPDWKPPVSKLHEEISHVELRLAVLKRIYGEAETNVELNKKQSSIARRMVEKEGYPNNL